MPLSQPLQTDSKFIQIVDSRASGTAGGTPSTGNWFARTLNTIKNDDTGVVTLANNQFILPAGTYIADIHSSFYRTARARCRLKNITDDITIANSINIFTGTIDIQCTADIYSKFTIAENKSLAIEYRVGQAYNASSLGLAASFGVEEIYTVINLYKL